MITQVSHFGRAMMIQYAVKRCHKELDESQLTPFSRINQDSALFEPNVTHGLHRHFYSLLMLPLARKRFAESAFLFEVSSYLHFLDKEYALFQ